MSDIYDSPRWQRVAGLLSVRKRLCRIVLHACVDGVEASEHGRQESGSTVKPIQYFVANLPPWVRYKLNYMLVHALIPAHLKGKAAKNTTTGWAGMRLLHCTEMVWKACA